MSFARFSELSLSSCVKAGRGGGGLSGMSKGKFIAIGCPFPKAAGLNRVLTKVVKSGEVFTLAKIEPNPMDLKLTLVDVQACQSA